MCESSAVDIASVQIIIDLDRAVPKRDVERMRQWHETL